MKCPFCGYTESKVIDSRPAEEGSTIRRRRECLACTKRFTTYEIIERMPLVVVKRDGSRQSFDKVKLINGMVRASEKRPVPLGKLEEIADEYDGKIKVCKVNVDDEPQLADQFGISSIPTVLVFKNGQLTATSVGYKEKDAILGLVK